MVINIGLSGQFLVKNGCNWVFGALILIVSEVSI